MQKKEDKLKIVLIIIVALVIFYVINPDFVGFVILKNEAPNPSFERDFNKDLIPDEWFLYNEGQVNVELTKDIFLKGRKSLLIELSEISDKIYGIKSIPLEVEPDKPYQFRIYAQPLISEGRFSVTIKCGSDSKQQEIINDKNSFVGVKDIIGEWEQIFITFKTKDTDNCKLLAVFDENSKGKVYLDSARFGEVVKEFVCGDGKCDEDENCPEDCAEATLTVQTLKDSYSVNEVVELTDPPILDTESVNPEFEEFFPTLNEPTSYKNINEIDNYKIKNYGYIIELEKEPILKQLKQDSTTSVEDYKNLMEDEFSNVKSEIEYKLGINIIDSS